MRTLYKWFEFSPKQTCIYSLFDPFVYTIVSKIFFFFFQGEMCFINTLVGHGLVVMRAQHVTRLAVCFEHGGFKVNERCLLQFFDVPSLTFNHMECGDRLILF